MRPFAFAIVIAGCATVPPDTETLEYKRADERIRVVERFEALTNACHAAGGIVYLDRRSGRFPPTADEMRIAKCARGW